MSNRELVRRGWHIAWNHKFLWALGFVTALLSFDFDDLNRANDLVQGSGAVENADAAALEPFTSLVDGPLLVLLLVGGFVLFVLALLWLLGLAARGGLYFAVAELDVGRQIGLMQAARAGARHLPRLALLNFLMYMPLFALIAMLIAAAISEARSFVGDLSPIGLPLFCVFFFYFLAVWLITPLAMRAVVLDGLGVLAAIRCGSALVRDNFGAIVGVGLYVLIYALPAGVVIFFTAAISVWLGAVVGVALNTLLDTFLSSTFTLAYRTWTGYEAPLLPDDAQPVPA